MKLFSLKLPWLAAVPCALLVSLCLAASASAGVSFTTAVPFGPIGSDAAFMISTSCTSLGNCVAVGLSAGSTGEIMLESNGTWGAPVATTTPSTASTSQLDSVSCTSATSCEATGIYVGSSGQLGMVVPITISGSSITEGTAITLNLPAGALSGGGQKASPNGISCTAGGCTIVGSYLNGSSDRVPLVATGSGGSWTSAAVSPPGAATEGAELNAVSCPSSGPCEAAGDYLNNSGDLYTWVVQLSGISAAAAQNVTMPADFVPATPASPFGDYGPVTPSTLGPTSISCPSSGNCTAAGAYGNGSAVTSMVVPITDGVPGGAVAISDGAGGAIAAISCSDANDCVAGGIAIGFLGGSEGPLPGVVLETGGTWAGMSELTLTAGENYGWVTGLSCSAFGACSAVGVEELSTSPSTTATGFAISSLNIETSSLPAATVGQPYTATLEGSGSGDASWSISPGSLPAGLSLNPSTGVISGTPTTAQQSGFIANLTAPGVEQSVGLSITVNPAAAPTPPVPTASVDIAYLSISSNKATVVLSCTGAACQGSLSATLKEKSGKTAAAAHRKSKTKTITVLSGRYSLAADHTKVVTLKLSKAALALLHKQHKLSSELDVTPTGAHQAAVIKKLTFTTR